MQLDVSFATRRVCVVVVTAISRLLMLTLPQVVADADTGLFVQEGVNENEMEARSSLLLLF